MYIFGLANFFFFFHSVQQYSDNFYRYLLVYDVEKCIQPTNNKPSYDNIFEEFSKNYENVLHHQKYLHNN